MAGVTLNGSWKFYTGGDFWETITIKNMDTQKYLIPTGTMVVEGEFDEGHGGIWYNWEWKKSSNDALGFFTLETNYDDILCAASENNPPNTQTNTLTVEGMLLK